jgi:hypothetical protein
MWAEAESGGLRNQKKSSIRATSKKPQKPYPETPHIEVLPSAGTECIEHWLFGLSFHFWFPGLYDSILRGFNPRLSEAPPLQPSVSFLIDVEFKCGYGPHHQLDEQIQRA